MKFSTYYFQRKTKILADFQICSSVPLIFLITRFLYLLIGISPHCCTYFIGIFPRCYTYFISIHKILEMFVFYRGWKVHSEVCFYLKHLTGCFKYPAGCFTNPAGCFFARPDISNIRSDVYLNNAFVIQYQNTRSDVPDNMAINLHYLVCKLYSRNIRPGIYNKFRTKNQITRSDSLK